MIEENTWMTHPHPTSTQYLQRYLFVRQKHVPVQVEEYRGVSLRTRWLADTIEKFTYRPSQSLITKLKLKQHIGVNFKPKCSTCDMSYRWYKIKCHVHIVFYIILYCYTVYHARFTFFARLLFVYCSAYSTSFGTVFAAVAAFLIFLHSCRCPPSLQSFN